MNSQEYARVAVLYKGATKYGFLLADERKTRGLAAVRFLNPKGWLDADVPADDLLGIVGSTFVSSPPFRPEVCERVTFFDRGRQRKGWVWDVEKNGRVTLLVDVKFRFPAGKTEEEALADEIEITHFFEERWVEEIVLMPLGKGWRRMSEAEFEADGPDTKNGEFKSLPSNWHEPYTEANLIEKGGYSQDHGKLAEKAVRGAERLRALTAKLATTKGA